MRPFALTPLLLLIAAAPATRPLPPQLHRARQILSELKDTVYQHKTQIDEKAGQYKCDCSGLVSYILRKELPRHYKAVPVPGPGRHPRAREFCDHFAACPAQPNDGDLWQQIPRVADIRPGDIIAWKRPKPTEPGESTGHVILADSAPRAVGENLFELAIIDSTTAPHKDDTRAKGQTGVGRGTIYLKTDPAGKPLSHASRSATGKFVEEPITIGRPVGKAE